MEKKSLGFSHHGFTPFGSGMLWFWHAAWSKPRLANRNLQHWWIEAGPVILAITFDATTINSWPAKLRWYAVGDHRSLSTLEFRWRQTHAHITHDYTAKNGAKMHRGSGNGTRSPSAYQPAIPQSWHSVSRWRTSTAGTGSDCSPLS